MTSPHPFLQTHLSLHEHDDFTPPKPGARVKCTDSSHTEADDLSSVYTKFGHGTRQPHPCRTARKTAAILGESA